VTNSTEKPWNKDEIAGLIKTLQDLRHAISQARNRFARQKRKLHKTHRRSAHNLLDYLVMRQKDIRALQGRLAALGLSSLGRAEACVAATLDAELQLLHRMVGTRYTPPDDPGRILSIKQGRKLLEANTRDLLGPRPEKRTVGIMVTMPSEAGSDYHLVYDMLAAGMNCMRINCAHDDAVCWKGMVTNLRRAQEELGKPCKILMDLAGPKLRTGALQPGPEVLKWRPGRDDSGNVVKPARIWLTPQEAIQPAPTPADACLPVEGAWLTPLQPGDRIAFYDARQSKRTMTIVEALGDSRWAESKQTTYVETGTELIAHTRHPEEESEFPMERKACIGPIPPQEKPILLRRGDGLVLTREAIPGQPAVYDGEGALISPARIPCVPAEIFDSVQRGEPIWLDDGKIGGILRDVGPDQIQVEILHAGPLGTKLRADKGINLPESRLGLDSLTPEDLDNLPFVAQHADMVGMSFVQHPSAIQELQSHLDALGASHLGIILKVETRRAFVALPSLLLTAMRSEHVGVMIARGDLAVECGFERLAEVQEEILWLCEAAHVPAIWATQVLETLAQTGMASRAEITDAAMGERAECVMLNKGPHIVAAIHALDGIIRRMEAHQSKKRSLLRKLRSWKPTALTNAAACEKT